MSDAAKLPGIGLAELMDRVYDEMPVAELREWAKQQGHSGYLQMERDDLIRVLKNGQRRNRGKMSGTYIQVDANPGANNHTAADEKIIGYSSSNGGGLISLMLRDDRLSVHLYRHDSTVDITIGKPDGADPSIEKFRQYARRIIAEDGPGAIYKNAKASAISAIVEVTGAGTFGDVVATGLRERVAEIIREEATRTLTFLGQPIP